MSMKPPSGLSASSRTDESDSEENSVDPEDLSDQIQVDASDDVTVEAAEDVTTESVTRTSTAPEPTPPPLSALAESAMGGSPKPILPSFFGGLGPSLPLPGVTAPSDEPAREIGDDITRLAGGINEDITRPAVTDDDDDEETKVEREDNVVRAAAGRDEVTTALSEQASFEREKALRKSGPSLFDGGARGRGDVEFEDPDGEGEIVSADPIISSADAISADPVDEDDEEIAAAADDDDIPDDEVRSADPDTDEIDEEDRMKLVARKAARLVDDGEEDAETFSKSPESSPLVAALTARRPGSPPLGSPFQREGGFGTRLPSPSGGYASLALQAPAQAPAPVSSPFGRLAPVASTSPYGVRVTSSSVPALQIPPPSGAAAPSEGTGLFRPFTLPLGGFVAAIFGALFVGVIFGAKLFGGATQAPPITVISSRPAPPAVTPPVVQPVPPPAASNPPGSAAGPEPPATAVPPPATPGGPSIAPLPGSGTGTAAMGTETGEPAPKPKRLLPPKPRKSAAATLEDPLAPTPKPTKPAKPAAKPSKAWVDPFAG
jgi:hypothetical protein